MEKMQIENCNNEVHCKEMCTKCYQKQYNSDNKEKRKQHRSDKKENKKEYDKQYRSDNKEKVKIRKKNYYSDNKEKLKVKKKQYYSEHKKEANSRQKQRGQSDPAFKLMCYVSSDINQRLKLNNSSKEGQKTWDNLPYTPEELRSHIEALWDHPDNLDGNGNVQMNWGNHSHYDPNHFTWQIDHIIPQSKLLFTGFDQPNFLKCWSLENLRPLEAIKNIRKGNKII